MIRNLLKSLSGAKGRSGKKGGELTAEGTVGGGRFLLFHIGAAGWRAQFLDASGAKSGDELKGELSHIPANPDDRIRQVVQQALEACGEKLLALADGIGIMLDDDGLFFSDAKQRGLQSASPASAREYGSKWLNRPDVTFGAAPIGTETAAQKQSSVYAFSDVTSIRTILSHFDKQAIKVKQIVPAAFMILAAGAGRDNAVQGALRIGAYSSSVVVANHGLGVASVRVLPFGFRSLAETVAAKTSIKLADAEKTLLERDLITRLNLSGDTEKSQLTAGPFEQALLPALAELIERARETLDHFKQQRASGYPETLELFGGFGRIKGLPKLLEAQLGLKIQPTEQSLFERFCDGGYLQEGNLLKGSQKKPAQRGQGALRLQQ